MIMEAKQYDTNRLSRIPRSFPSSIKVDLYIRLAGADALPGAIMERLEMQWWKERAIWNVLRLNRRQSYR